MQTYARFYILYTPIYHFFSYFVAAFSFLGLCPSQTVHLFSVPGSVWTRVYRWFGNEHLRIFPNTSEPEPGLLIPNISEYFRIFPNLRSLGLG